MRGATRIQLVVALMSVAACGRVEDPGADLSARRVQAVATTSIVADVVREVGGDHVEVTSLMGPGVDPHLYRASEGDVRRMGDADIVFFNGLHLEGRMGEVLEEMGSRGTPTVAIAEAIGEESLQRPPEFAGAFDPHVWMDVTLWERVVGRVAESLAELDPANAEQYRTRAGAYETRLRTLDAYVRQRIERVDPARRVLVTAHDAFNYFGRAYGFEVRGLQGVSTATEAGAADVQQLADFIAERRIPAIFVESSVPPRSIEALKAAVQSRGFDVAIGGQLFSDALGDPDKPEGTYTGMVRYNIDTIVTALGK